MEKETETNKQAFDFIKRFSSFESALRLTDTVRKERNANIIWDDVKKILKTKNFKLTDEQKEFEIFKNPPKKLKFENVLSWELGPISTNEEDLVIDVLVRVRNNLFHGSKHFGDSSESQRNRTLIDDALVVLSSVVKHVGVEDAYEDVLSYWS